MPVPLITAPVPQLFLGRMLVGQCAPPPVFATGYMDIKDAFDEWPDAATAYQEANASTGGPRRASVTGAGSSMVNRVYTQDNPTQWTDGPWHIDWINEGGGLSYWIMYQVTGGGNVSYYINFTGGVLVDLLALASPWFTYSVGVAPVPVVTAASSTGSGFGAFFVATDAHLFSDGAGAFQFFLPTETLPGMLTAQEGGYGLVNEGATQPIGALYDNTTGYVITPAVSRLVMKNASAPDLGEAVGQAVAAFGGEYLNGVLWRVPACWDALNGVFVAAAVGLASPEDMRPPERWWDGR